MKYVGTYWRVLSPRIKKSLSNRYSKDYANEIMTKAQPIYKKLISEMEGMSPENPMSMYIYMPFTLLAVWSASDKKISPDELKDIMRDVVDWKPLKIACGMINMNTRLGIKIFGGMMHYADKWTKRHPEDTNTWDFNFDENLHKDGFYYHFTYCPLYDFCKNHGFEEINRAICEMDTLTMSMMHSRLIRKNVLSEGGKMCDYWTIGDKIKEPQ